MNKNDETTLLASWWPTTGIFEKSSLNVSFWSPDCERFYQFHRTSHDTLGSFNTVKTWRTTVSSLERKLHAIHLKDIAMYEHFLVKKFII